METDSQLLRRYLHERSELAFTELVQRHMGVVYSVALRRVGGDVQLAQDVAQKVFCDLARKAPTLTDRATLAGWLYASAHVASAGTVRGEQRRKLRENEAHFMQTTLAPQESDANWSHLQPVLDDVIVTLNEDERAAIALRFFEKRSFAEVGATLRVTEEAARKRVDRVLDKLHTLLARKGITSTAAALALSLTAMSSPLVTAEITAKVAAHALAHSGAATAASGLASAFLPIAALLVGGLFLGSQFRVNQQLHHDVAELAVANQEIATILTENLRLVSGIAEMESARSLPLIAPSPARVPDLSPMRTPPRPTGEVITITKAGTITWGGDRVTLEEFTRRLKQLQTDNLQSRVTIRGGENDRFSTAAYVFDEVRKAQVNHVTIETSPAPDPNRPDSWF